MDKKEQFLNELRTALRGEVSEQVFQETVAYYDRYIDSEMKSGKPIDDIIAMLGSGRIIAKTVIETKGNSFDTVASNRYDEQVENKAEKRAEFLWKAKTIAIVAVILVALVALLGFVLHVVWVLLPVIIIVAIVSFIVNRI